MEALLETKWDDIQIRPHFLNHWLLCVIFLKSGRSQSFTSLQIDVPRMVELNSSKGMSQSAPKVMKVILQSWTSVEGCKAPGIHTRYKSWMNINVFVRCLEMSHEWSMILKFCMFLFGKLWQTLYFCYIPSSMSSSLYNMISSPSLELQGADAIFSKVNAFDLDPNATP